MDNGSTNGTFLAGELVGGSRFNIAEIERRFESGSDAERWGIPVNDAVVAENVGSFTRDVAETAEFVETLTFTWEAHGAMMGHLVFEFENRRVEIPIHMAGMQH